MITFAIVISCVLSLPPTWTPLIVGNELEGWTIVNGDKSTWTIKDDMIVCSGKPTGVIRTNKVYENFILELDWRHMVENGNAGLFVWSDPFPAIGVPFTKSIEVQIMDGKELDWYTTHGDIFSIWGATMTPDVPHPKGDHIQRCLPSERRSKPAPEWNHYTVTCIDGTIKLSVNGAFVSGAHDVTPRKGHICLESEGTEVYFKNINIMELPPSSPVTAKAEEVEHYYIGFNTLFTGINLQGWIVNSSTKEHWSVNDNILTTDGNGIALKTVMEYKDYEFVVDYRCKDQTSKPYIILNGVKTMLFIENAGHWNREPVNRITGRVLNGQISIGSDEGSVDFCNIFVRTMK